MQTYEKDLLVLLSDSGKLSFLTFNIELHRCFIPSEMLIAIYLSSDLAILIFGHAVTSTRRLEIPEKNIILTYLSSWIFTSYCAVRTQLNKLKSVCDFTKQCLLYISIELDHCYHIFEARRIIASLWLCQIFGCCARPYCRLWELAARIGKTACSGA